MIISEKLVAFSLELYMRHCLSQSICNAVACFHRERQENIVIQFNPGEIFLHSSDVESELTITDVSLKLTEFSLL